MPIVCILLLAWAHAHAETQGQAGITSGYSAPAKLTRADLLADPDFKKCWGEDLNDATMAGSMKYQGSVFVALPKDIAQ